MPQSYKHTISFKPVSKTIAVAKDGAYRFAIRTWENTGLAVFVRNITLNEGCKLAAPDSVQSLKVVPGAKGTLKATISFVAPTKTIEGKTLSSLSSINIYDGLSLKASKTRRMSNPERNIQLKSL